ncbi:MAG: hypothetical protein SNJ71_07750 [Bacteroidales bacterium]
MKYTPKVENYLSDGKIIIKKIKKGDGNDEVKSFFGIVGIKGIS